MVSCHLKVTTCSVSQLYSHQSHLPQGFPCQCHMLCYCQTARGALTLLNTVTESPLHRYRISCAQHWGSTRMSHTHDAVHKTVCLPLIRLDWTSTWWPLCDYQARVNDSEVRFIQSCECFTRPLDVTLLFLCCR